MATTLPTFKNNTSGYLPAPRYNFSDIEVPPGKYIVGDYYLTNNTLDGESTGVAIYEVLGFTNVSSGTDPDPADIAYDYNAAYAYYSTTSGYSGYSGYSGFVGQSGYSGISGVPGGTSGYSGYSGWSGYSGQNLGHITGLPTYVDNAAALTGGLVSDDIYRTPTGELRIVYVAD